MTPAHVRLETIGHGRTRARREAGVPPQAARGLPAARRPSTARLGAPLTGHGSSVVSVAFSPDGCTIIDKLDVGP